MTTAVFTLRDALNRANPSQLCDALAKISFGGIISGLADPTAETLTTASAAVELTDYPIPGTLRVEMGGVLLAEKLTAGAVGSGRFTVSGKTVTVAAGTSDSTAVSVKYAPLPFNPAILSEPFASLT